MNSHYQIQPRGVASAPAHIAFRTTSSADVDVDISPLTSPWLGAQQHHTSYPQRNKRTASSSGDESSSKPSRKKQSQSPAIRPYNATPAPKRTTRTTKSTTSTPLLRSTQRPRHGSLIGNDVVGDSPSPVDLSMPPPASTSSHTISTPPTDNTFSSPSLTPVTPASIMNLGRLGVSATNNLASRSQDRVGKAAPNGSVTRTKSARRGSVGTSPALKPLLPGKPPRSGRRNKNANHKSQPDLRLLLFATPPARSLLYRSAKPLTKRPSKNEGIPSRQRSTTSVDCSLPYRCPLTVGITTNLCCQARCRLVDHPRLVAMVPTRL